MVYTHLVPATIDQARLTSSKGDEDARLFARLDALLACVRSSRGKEKAEALRQLRGCESELAAHFERSGRSILAEAMLNRPLDGEPDEG